MKQDNATLRSVFDKTFHKREKVLIKGNLGYLKNGLQGQMLSGLGLEKRRMLFLSYFRSFFSCIMQSKQDV